MADKIKAPIRIFKFSDSFDETSLTLKDLELISSDLQVPLRDVELYFRHYSINKRYPIKSLDQFDLQFVDMLFEWKAKHPGERISVPEFLATIQQSLHGYERDFVERKIVHYLSYEDFLLTPYIVYGNAEPPYHYTLSNYQIQIMLSRLALGEFSSRYEKFVPANVRVRSLELLVRMREGKGGGDIVDVDNEEQEIDLTKLSTRELLEIVKYSEGRDPKGRHAKPTEEEKIPKTRDVVDAEVEVATKRPGRPRTGEYDESYATKTTPHKPNSDKRKMKRKAPSKPGPKPERRGRPPQTPKPSTDTPKKRGRPPKSTSTTTS